jgi:hypothetical protein
MSEQPNLILEHLRVIRAEIAMLCSESKETRERVAHLEHRLAGVYAQYAGVYTQYASVSERLDRIFNALERIELRLEIAG